MKKTILFALSLVMCLGLLTACGGDKEESSVPDESTETPTSTVETTQTVEEILTTIDTLVPVNTPKDLDEKTLSLLMNVDMENVAAYAGKVTELNNNTDQIIVIQAVPGQAEAVKADLEAWKQAMIEQSANYTEFAGEGIKAENGRVVVNGDYVVLVILGDGDDMLANGPDAFYKTVDEAITKAFI